jgi:pimeloyl-ACP methyl ester carboxylesterase
MSTLIHAAIEPYFRTVDGLSIRLAESADPGRGTSALLLSPWPESLFAFEPTWSRLAEHAHLVAVDLPGFGHSERRDALLSPRAMGEFIVRLADELGLEQPHVVGPDVGTGAALFAAALHPGRLRSLVVGSGGSAFPLQLGGVLKEWVEAPDLEPYRSVDGRQVVDTAMAALERYVVPDHVREDYRSSYEGERFAESMRYVRAYPAELPVLRDLLPDLRTPVQIIAGRRDTFVPPANAEFLHERLPASRLDVIDAGHFTWEDAADRYAEIVTAWWDGGYAAAGSSRADERAHDRDRRETSRQAPSPGTPSASRTVVSIPALTATPPATKFVDVNGVRVATRSIGTGEPLVLLHRFRGTLDDWDPALLAALARERRVICFDSVGVGESEGVAPDAVEPMADFAASVVQSLGPGAVDVLGYSLGGFVAQVLAIKYPHLVRRLILAATMPPGGVPNVEWSRDWLSTASSPVPSPAIALSLFYTETPASRAAGAASFGRVTRPPSSYVSPEAMAAQARAIARFADGEDGWDARLKEIAAPTFVANGDRDGLFPAIDSAVLAREIPNSRLAIYPDSGHGFLFQYAERFSDDVLQFLGQD